MSSVFLAGWAAAGCAVAGVAGARADVVTLTSTRDNTLFESTDGGLSNGSGPFMFSGRSYSGLNRRALVRFDIAAAGIPAGATITGATLTLHMSQTATASESVGLHRVLADWGEGTSNSGSGGGPGQGGGGGAASKSGDATWIHTFYDTSFWTTPGGDFDPVSSADAGVAGVAFYTWGSAQLATDVQGWLSDPATNFGWLLRGDEDTDGTAKRFDSRENNDPTVRPMLTITFTPSPGSFACLLTGTVLLTRRSRRPTG